MRPKHTFLLLFAFVVYFSSVSAQTITTFAGNGYGATTGTGGYTGNNGPAVDAELYNCSAVTFDGAGNVYIADQYNNVVREVSYNGIITTFAGTGTAGFSGDSVAATSAQLDKPYGVAVDIPGNVYIADYGNNVVRKVDTSGIITTYAGTGVAGYSGDGGPATMAQLNRPEGIATDQYGNVFVTEGLNHTVREIYTSGNITTIAGNGTLGYSGNGGNANAAQLWGPSGVTVDVYGNVYIADYYNNVVRMVDTNGIISTFAGSNVAGSVGDGGPATSAQLRLPSGVSIFGHGNLFIADQGNNVIREVNQSGTISLYAGSYTNGYSGDGGPATDAQLSIPKGLAVDGVQRVYIADYDNNVIRLVNNTATGVNTVTSASAVLNVYPNPASGSFTVELPQTGSNATVTVMDVTGRIVATNTVDAQSRDAYFNLGEMPAGCYFVQATTRDKTYRQKVVIVK